MRTILAIWLFIASAPTAAADGNEYANIHTVAVISALGNDVEMRTYGATAFDNAFFRLHSDWNLDDEVRDQITKALAGHFTIKTVAVDPQAFANISEEFIGGYLPDVERRVKLLPKVNGVDAYVVVTPVRDTFGAFEWKGFNVTRALGLISAGTTYMDIHYVVGVFDAATGDRIDFGTGKYPSSTTLTGNSIPLEYCSNAMWADAEEQLTADQRARIRQEMASLLSRSIAYALASAKLINKADAAAATAQFALPGDPSCHSR